jgi:hypothetical protein
VGVTVAKPPGLEGFELLHPTIKAAVKNAITNKQPIIFFTFTSPDFFEFQTEA